MLIFPRFCLFFDYHSIVRLRHLVPRCVGSRSHVKCLCLLYWENTGKYTCTLFFFFVTVFLVWIQTVALCGCVWMCIFLLRPYLFIKRKTHLHKKASEHRKNVYFVFLSVAPRHAGFLWGILKTGFHLKQGSPPPTGKLSFLEGRGFKMYLYNL